MKTLRIAGPVIIAWLAAALLLPQAAMAQGSGADAQAAALVQQASAAANNIMTTAAEMLKARNFDDMTAQFDRLHSEVVEPLVKAGEMSCAAVDPGLTVVLGVIQKYARMGIEPRASLSTAAERLNPMGGKCEEDAKAQCRAKKDPQILIRFWTMSRRAALAGTSLVDDKYDALLAKRAKHFCTENSYSISGNAGPMKVSGKACDLKEPFTVSGGGGGMNIRFSYAPGGETGGTLKQTHTGKVLIVGGGSATHTDTLTLTKIEPPC